ncbi:hypothetical protein Q7P35_003908 [Cladosporium inversicolor]
MPPLTLKNPNTSNGAPTSTPISNDAPTNRQDSAHPPLILHLNAKQRKEAEAAVKSLQNAQAALERHRPKLNGRAVQESSVTQPLLKSCRAAIRRFSRIPHPGALTREKFEAARRDFEETTSIMASDLQIELDVELWLQGGAEA